MAGTGPTLLVRSTLTLGHAQNNVPPNLKPTDVSDAAQETPLADASESQVLRRTKRSIVVPTRAKQEVEARAEKRAMYERQVNARKRKAFAEARDSAAAAADDESSDELEQDSAKRSRNAFEDSLLMLPYDHLTNESDRTKWLLAAIYRRDGDDLRNSGYSCEDLEERWEETGDAEEDQVDHYAGITIDRVEHRVADGRVGATPRSTVSASQPQQLKPTDHSTIGPGAPIVYRGTRQPNGKPTPIEGRQGKLTPGSQGVHPSQPASQQPIGRALNVVGSGDDIEGEGDSDGDGDRVTLKGSARPPLSGSQTSAHGYATGFRITPVPQPRPRGSFRPPVPQSALRLSSQSSQHASQSQHTPRRSLHNPPAASPPNHARASRSVTPQRASVPAGSPHYVRANSTPNRPPAANRHGASVPREIAAPFPDEAAHVPDPPAGGDTDLEEETDNGQLGQSAFDDGDDPDDGLTRRQRAQLRRFGPARRLVQMLNRRIKLRAITECPYADVLPLLSEPDEDGNRHVLGVLIDVWLPEEWAEVNRLLRPGLPPLPLLEPYCTHCKDDFSGIRNHAKGVLQVMVPSQYQFTPGFSEENKTKSEDLLPDVFHRPQNHQQPEKMQFQHPILVDAIRGCWFSSRRAVGFMHADKFRPMPLPTIAFICTIIHFLISDYSSGEQKLSNLDAEAQAPWYERYLELMEDMGKPQNCPQRLANIQRRAFDLCHGKFHATSRAKIQPPVVEYGTDSEEEYQYAHE